MYGYKERKAAQTAAFFALKAGGTINKLKLVKLLYLSERESMLEFDEPLFFDRLVSMDYGPVTSISLDHINGLKDSKFWPSFIRFVGLYDVSAVEGITETELDDLSKADRKILEKLWAKFENFSQFELAEWTHRNCPEWENPKGSSKPINHELVYKFLAKENAEELAADVEEYRSYNSAIDDC